MPSQNKQKKQRQQSYPSDLTDKQWKLIKPLIPPAKSNKKKGGRPRQVDMREIVDAIFYFARSGCAWRMLPHDLPDYRLVRHYFDAWKKDGTWKKMHDALRSKVRKKVGKKKQPTAAIIDSQSVKTTEKGGFVAMMLGKR